MSLIARPLSKFVQNFEFAHWLHNRKAPRLLSGAFVRQLTERIGADALRFLCYQSLSKKQMLHKTRARNARPYGHGGVMRSSFFLQHCRGAHRAPVIGICAKFRICSFTDATMTYGTVAGSPLGSPSGRAVTEGD